MVIHIQTLDLVLVLPVEAVEVVAEEGLGILIVQASDAMEVFLVGLVVAAHTGEPVVNIQRDFEGVRNPVDFAIGEVHSLVKLATVGVHSFVGFAMAVVHKFAGFEVGVVHNLEGFVAVEDAVEENTNNLGAVEEEGMCTHYSAELMGFVLVEVGVVEVVYFHNPNSVDLGLHGDVPAPVLVY